MSQKPIEVTLLENKNLHIHKGGLTLYCGSAENARDLYRALTTILGPGRQQKRQQKRRSA